MLEHKTTQISGFKVLNDDEGVVEAVVSVTGIEDKVKDRILPGAYAKTLASRKPKGVWSHSWDKPVSRTVDVVELNPGDSRLPKTLPNGDPWPKDAGGVLVKTQFNLKTQRGREAYEDIKFFGNEQEWSIGYHVPVDGSTVDHKTGIREISSLDWYEYSPVLFGAMPMTATMSVKDAQTALKTLKEAGVDKPVEPWKDDDTQAIDMGDFLGDGDPTPPADQVTDDRLRIVREAIDVLIEAKQAEEEQSAGVEPAGTEEGAPAEESEEEDEDEDVEDYESLAQATEQIVGSKDFPQYDTLMDNAEDFDSAVGDDDTEGAEDGAEAFLDTVEEALDATEDEELQRALRTLAGVVADMLEEQGGKVEEGGQEEGGGEGATPAAGAPPAAPPSEEKREFSSATRQQYAEQGIAMPDGSFPIPDKGALQRAIKSIGRAKDRAATERHILKRAKALGAMDLVPDWMKGEKSEKEDAVVIDLAMLAELKSILGK